MNGKIRLAIFGREALVSYAKVAEYQRRGVVHCYAIIRLDGPTGPGHLCQDATDCEVSAALCAALPAARKWKGHADVPACPTAILAGQSDWTKRAGSSRLGSRGEKLGPYVTMAAS